MANNRQVHFFYIIGILLAIIIIQFVIEFSEMDDVVNLFGFGATITSLVVGLIAIVFAFYANFSQSQKVDEFNNISNSLKKSIDVLHDSTYKLNGKIEEIPSYIDSFNSRLEEVSGIFDQNKTSTHWKDKGDNYFDTIDEKMGLSEGERMIEVFVSKIFKQVDDDLPKDKIEDFWFNTINPVIGFIYIQVKQEFAVFPKKRRGMFILYSGTKEAKEESSEEVVVFTIVAGSGKAIKDNTDPTSIAKYVISKVNGMIE